MPAQDITAVLFDIGGVLLSSPLTLIRTYSASLGLPEDYLNVLITALGREGAWARFERGELGLWDFYAAWSAELGDAERGKRAFGAWCAKRGTVPPSLPEGVRVDARELFGMMMRHSQAYDPYILHAVQALRRLGKHRVIALTNNYTLPYDRLLAAAQAGDARSAAELQFLGWERGPAPEEMRALFDDFVDSSQVGSRKPERRIYELACARNGVRPEACVFLDDIGENLKTGKGLGMRTIQVRVGRTREAVRELEGVLGVELLEGGDEGPKARL